MLCVELPPQCLVCICVTIAVEVDAERKKRAIIDALLAMEELNVPVSIDGDNVSMLRVPRVVIDQLKALNLSPETCIGLCIGEREDAACVVLKGKKRPLAAITAAVLARK
jgi:hypothetical protein